MKLEGLKINFLGDSITEGTGVLDVKGNRYDNILARECGIINNNYGIGGTRLAHQSVPSEKPRHDLCFAGRAYNMDKNADVIIVYGGINDYIHGDAPIGNDTDATPATFKGAVRFLMNLLKSEYPLAKIAFMTPARCFIRRELSSLEPSRRAGKREDAKPVKFYVDVIKNTAGELGIPVLDLYDGLGIDPNVPEDYEKYTADGLHFNDAGHRVIADRLKEFLETL